MANTNYPSANNPGSDRPVKSSNNTTKNIVIGVLTAIILGLGGYLVYDLTKDKEKEQVYVANETRSNTTIDSLRGEYDDALLRLDSITGSNNNLSGQLGERQAEISKLRTEINRILKNKNATEADLRRARTLIAQLNSKIGNLEAEVARLTGENQELASNNAQLTAEKTVLETNLQTTTAEKEELATTVDVASTFSASNITIKPFNEKRSGKEKETTTAKRVDKLVISFDVENRIARSGPADLYVVVTGPNGQVVTDPNIGSGTLTTRLDGDRPFSFKTTINYEQNTRKNVSVPLRRNDFQTGDYKIEIYQNGFKIAEGVRTLKKGGLFS
jgi:regulator of replication initiation timing